MANPLLIDESKPKSKTHVLKKEIENAFIDNLFLYKSPTEAARRAGYSEKYSKNIKSLKLRDSKFLSRIKERYNGNAVLILPEIFQSESRSINLSNKMVSQLEDTINDTDDIDEKVELTNKALNILAKAAPTRKELKQSAGVLQSEHSTQINLVNVEQIQAVISGLHEDKVNKDTTSDNM